MKSWKTTIVGTLAAIGLAASGLNDAEGLTWIEILSALFAAALGVFARDNNVTSEKAGAKS